jgi:hypothetical protein
MASLAGRFEPSTIPVALLAHGAECLPAQRQALQASFFAGQVPASN